MDSAEKSEFFRLLSALCDQQLSSAEGERLATRLRESAECRVAYVRYIDLHASLKSMAVVSLAGADFETRLRRLEEELGIDVAEDSAGTVPEHEGSTRAVPAATRAGRVVGPSVRWMGPLAALAAAVVMAFFVWPQGDRPAPLVDPELTPVVARLTGARDCTWESSSGPLAEGAPLRAGQQLVLKTGVARLVFNDQTTALVESPASLELVSESSLRLHSGTVALRADGLEKDFVVLTPNASIVDLGTSFGVHSGPDGDDVEVFEGSVEILPDNDANRSQVLGLGASARLEPGPGEVDINMFAAHKGRFTDLLQMLWEDMPTTGTADDGQATYPRAEFSEVDGTRGVDTFHGATSGKGWITPWVASGSPVGEVRHDNPLSGDNNPYLKVRFYRSTRRTIAREYGATASFDPTKPHVISWVWRFEGLDEDFGDSFHDRVVFFGMPYFRDNSSEDTNWMITWAGNHEKVGLQRSAVPKRWVVFDGAKGAQYDPANLVDTGMTLKPGVVYRMAVVLYPQMRQYDAIIQDDEKTFVRAGLHFRSRSGLQGKVVHFGVGSDRVDGDASFSIDSIRIEPLRPDLIPRDLRFNVPSDPGGESSTVHLPASDVEAASNAPGQ